jgi:hypothetical protein
VADFVMLLVCEVKSAKELHDRHLGKRLALHLELWGRFGLTVCHLSLKSYLSEAS